MKELVKEAEAIKRILLRPPEVITLTKRKKATVKIFWRSKYLIFIFSERLRRFTYSNILSDV